MLIACETAARSLISSPLAIFAFIYYLL